MLALALLVLGGQALLAETAAAGPCDPPNNEIVCENSKAGNPAAEWDVSGGGDPGIQGFATDISVDQGGTVQFKVDTPSTDYRLDIYRMGYYGGSGARKITTVQPSASLPQSQPPCAEESATGLIDCGNWAVSASWAVPASAVSGIYFAKLVREDTASGGSHVIFVVRDDDGSSDLLFQTSDSTWQAYNRYGGRSLYTGSPGTNPGRAYAVSYNRPLTVRGPVAEDSPFNAEYPMVRWLERNGYDVSYSTDVDSDRRGAEILEHEAFLSVGHDEYWSGQQRANVAAARDAGVDLAFFSGNELFWKTRWRNSIAGPSTAYRTLVSYKETHANSKIDPEPSVWTGTWRDPRFSPPADGGRQENELSGTAFAVNSGTTEIVVPADDGKMRLWRGTGIAELGPGQTATLGEDTLGYEWDEAPEDETRPAGLIHLSTRTVNVSQKLLDYGSTYGSGPVTHHLTLYRAPSGALVFGAGTIQWSWGLDGVHDRGATTPDSRMQQATVNLFADMGVQPGTLQAGLAPATQSADGEAPTATIATPADGADVEIDQPMTIAGSAADAASEGGGGGEVGAVEVSVDGGETWLPAQGRESWTYSWTPEETGEVTVMARAVDDSGNIQAPGDVAEVEVGEGACPCTIWDDSVTGPQDSDKSAIEVGVKFRADETGFITGIRFYKTAGNTGTHVGRLWTLGGTQLGVASFAGETATGWQQATFPSPVPINAGTTYVASYHAPNGRYASLNGYFSVVGADNPPLHALANGVDGPNGIYKYTSTAGGLFGGGGPNTFNAENYLVDVVFEDELLPDTTPPQISSRSPVGGATDISTDVDVSATFDEPVNPATIDGSRVELRDPSNNLVPATVSYDAAQRTVTLNPTASLQQGVTYTAKVKGGAGGVADVAGNLLAATSTWSFTTVPPPPPPPDEGPGGPILVISNTSNPFSRYYGEILRAEGLNAFTTTDIANVTPAVLGNHDVAILGEGALSAAQATTLSNWVQAGGNLIAMRPDSDLLGLLGLTSAGGTLGNAYLQVNTGSSPGTGIVGQTIQFHGTADRYTLSGAQSVATLFSSASTGTANPAVTLRSIGSNGGQAAAFTYDLARSIVYTRQGNPAWNAQERDGLSPIRSDDLFFGAKAGDSQPDWVDLNKVAIPQADEQQRLLTNLIGEMNKDRKPLPRFWFLPRDEMAAVVMTGDDHAHNGTQGRFEHFKTLDPPGCVVANWECVRASSYIYPDTPITNAKAGQLAADGFEIALHAWTNCQKWDDREDLEDHYTEQLGEFAAIFPSLPSPTTNRTHCIVWSDWATQPKVELENGIRLDTTYYYWPEGWVQNRPGMFTGSGMPMRFADLDGSMIDVYQAATQMTDESGQAYPATANALLDKALGPEGYYGVFTANIHTDKVAAAEADAIIASAQARGVPVVSARQMLTWLDGRNQSSFESIAWNGDELEFEIAPGAGANGLRAMLPTRSAGGLLAGIERAGSPVTTTTRTIKGVEYAFFDAVAGSYAATYLDDSLPIISNVQVAAQNNGTATVTWTTNEPTDSRVDYGTSPGSLTLSKSSAALVTSHSIQLTGLEPGVTYHFRVTSADSEANSTTTPGAPIAPATFATPPPAPAPSSTVPASPANNNSPKVLGTAAAGSTVRIYATADCSGAPLATGTAAAFTTGIEAPVADNSTTGFRATATSAAGASTCSAPLSYVEDSSAPLTQIDTAPPALSNSGAASFTFSGSDPGGAGVTFQCRLDSTAPGAWTTCTSPRALSSLAEGSHTFEVRAIDQAGNADATPASFTWTLDSVAPNTQIDSQPPAFSSSAAANFTFSGSDTGGSGVASFQCRLDSTAPAAWAACTSSKAFAGLSEGSHTFEVRSIDLAGNTDASPASFTWTVDTVAPNTTIDSNPPALSPSTGANFTFSGTDTGGSGVASFQCRLDSTAPAAWAACTSPRALSSLAEGSHTFEVRALDAAGNIDQSPAGFTWTVDSVAPQTQLDTSPPALSNSAAASFVFSGSDAAGSGVSSFQCRLDSTAPAAWAACTSPKAFAGLSDGSHTFEVRAVDTAGNADASPAVFSWSVDTKAPQTAIDSNPLAVSNTSTANFTFHGEDPGGSGPASMQCRRDSSDPGDWQPCVSPLKYTSLAEGAHTFEVRAIDQAGNVDPSPATFAWTIDTVAPNAAIDSSPPAFANSATADFSLSGTDPGGSGVASLECRLDSTSPGAWAPCTSPRQYTGLVQGAHTFEVRAIDAAGNVDQSPAAFSWSVDTAAPNTTIDSSPPALSNSAAANFTFSGSDSGGSGVASFQCRLDSTAPGAWAACTSPKAFAGLGEGSHTFEVRAVDQAGNADQSPASFTWTVDTATPQPPALSAMVPASPANNNSPKVVGSAVAGTTVRLYTTSDCSGAPTATVTPAQLEEGVVVSVPDDSTTAFRATATSGASNTSACSAPLTYVEDSKAPETQIDSNPPALTSGTSANFTFSGTDTSGSGVASFQCRLDSTAPAAWAACTSPKAFAGLVEGSHTFEVRALDQAGNIDQSPAAFTWTVDSVAPQTQIDSNPPTLANSAAANFTFSGTDAGGSGVASFQCRLDSTAPGAWAACTSPRSLSGLGEGSHTFEVRAIDQAGNTDQTPAAFTWTVDSVGPQTQIDSSPPALSSSNAANFTFSGSDAGGSGVASFECRLDSSAPGAWAPCTSPRNYGSLSDGSHAFEVRAVDQAGNPDGSPASFTWNTDTAAPNTTIDSSPPALSNSAAANFIFSGSDTGGSGVASFQCRLDSTAPGAWAACTSPKAFAGLSEGSHTFEVRVLDQAGNVDQSPASFTWSVDSVAPNTAIDSSPPALTSSAAANFTFSGTDTGGSGVASFQCRLDSSAPAAWAACTSPRSLSSLSEGSHTFEVRATDQAGNVDQSPAVFTWTVDTAAPNTAIDSNPTALINSTSANFTFSGSDTGGSGIASFQCRLDSTAPGAWGPCASPRDLAALSDGAHTFEVRALDNAGNIDPTPSVATWTVDTATPNTAIDSNPPSLTNSASANFIFSGSDTGGSGVSSFQCRLDSTAPAAWAACASPKAFTGLGDGSHTFEVRAVDQAGNIDQSPASFTWTIDTAAPQVPTLNATVPASPANDNSPKIFGSALAGATVRLYTTSDCSGAPIATVTAAQLEAGVGVSVADDSTTSFRATATDTAANTSGCSSPLTYVEDSEAPETQIDSKPPALSNSAAANFTFSGSDTGGSGVASFQCRLDSTAPAAWAACASPKALAGLGEGSHTFEVRAIDQAGNADQSPASFSWSVDTKAPETQIDSGPPAAAGGTAANFTFSGSDTGGSGIASFQCRLDSTVPGAWAACTSPKAFAGLSEGSHTFEVRAIDTAGNTDGTPASFNWTVDTAAPLVVVDSLSKALLKAGESSEVTWHADANGNFSLRLGGADCDAGVVLGSGSYGSQPAVRVSNVAAGSLAEGANTLRLCLADAAGNRGETTFTIGLDTAAPETAIDSKPSALSNSTGANFTFSGSDTGGSGIASFQCRLDSTAPGAWAACASPRSLSGLAEGAHAFEVRAIDQAGNVDATPASFTWTVDSVQPQTQINSQPPALTNSAAANFAFSGSDTGGSGVTSFQCRFDSTAPGAWAACTSPKAFSGLSEGSHTFEVRALDQAGNTDATPATFTWVVDTAAPQTQIDSGPLALSDSADATFAFSATDTGGSGVASFECRRDSGGAEDWFSCSSPRKFTSLAEGSHSFEVRATDAAGNVDATPASFTWVIDTVAPSTAIDASPPALAASTGANFTFSGTDAGGSGVASFQCRLDSTAPDAWAACTSPKAFAGLSDGSHTFEVRTMDQAGNVDTTPSAFGWTVDTTAPTVTIDSGPAGLTNDSTPTFAFHSESGAELECSIDTGTADFQPCSASGSHTPSEPLADGPYTFRVRAEDAAGNHATTTRGFTVDTASPNPPELSATVPASPANNNSPKVVGSAVAGTTVRLYTTSDCSGAPTATVTPAQLEAGVVVSAPDDSTTAFRATATSGASNTSACSAPLTYVEDSKAPETQIDSKPPALSNSAAANFTFSGSDTGGSGVASFECRIDSTAPAAWAACTSPKAFAGLVEGSHTFEVRALDQAGNIDQSPAAFEWAIDTAAPSTAIDSNPSALTNSANANFTFSGADAGGSGVASFQCRLDSTAPGAWTSCASPKDYASLGNGTHTFEVRAVDRAGNTDASPASHAWEIDSAIPGVPELSATVPGSPANDNTPEILGSAPAGTAIRLYTTSDCSGAPIATMTAAELEGGVEVSVADNSTTDFRATATSSAANSSACSVPLTYVEDSSAPQTQIDSGPPTLSGSAAASFTFSATDGAGSGVASFECRLDSSTPGDWQPCSSPKNYAVLADGPHGFEARAIDSAGNVDSSPALDEWVIDTTSPKQPEPETKPQPEVKPPAGPGPTPSASLRFLRVKYNKKDGTAFLILEVSGPGELSARAPEIKLPNKGDATAAASDRLEQLRQKRIKTKRIQTTRAGLVKLKIRLAPAGQKLLDENGKLKITVVVDFKATDGSSVTRTTNVTLRKLLEDEAQPSPLSRPPASPQH